MPGRGPTNRAAPWVRGPGPIPSDEHRPQTLLEALIRHRQLTWDEAAELVAAQSTGHESRPVTLSARHIARLARRERRGTPIPSTGRALQRAFGHPITDLLAPYRGQPLHDPADPPGAARDHQEVLTMAADRAQRFALDLPGLTDVTVDEITHAVRELLAAYQTRPIPEVLTQLASTQDLIFGLLERPQRPGPGRDLYFLAGVTGGLLANASHELGNPSAAMSQSRAAFLCAEQAGHNGLRAWICALQSLIPYWAGRPRESLRHAQRGTPYLTGSTTGSVAARLAACEARCHAQLGNTDATLDAIHRAEDAAATAQPDDLDQLGGLAYFSRPRQLYYTADALTRLPEQASAAADYAGQALDAYRDPDSPDFSAADQAISRADLAIARIELGELDGAAEALGPVLALAPEWRKLSVIKAAGRVHTALTSGPAAGSATELQERIEDFTRTPVRAIT